MSLVGRLESWRKSLTADFEFEGKPPPTDEQVLDQFVYSAISDFLDAELDEIVLRLERGIPDDVEHRAALWTDLYAERTVFVGIKPPQVPRRLARPIPNAV